MFAQALQLRRMFELEGIDHVALAVRSPAASARWYVDVLGFELRHVGMWDGVPLFVRTGTTALALFPVNAVEPLARPARSITMLHVAFRATGRDFAAAQKELTLRRIAFHFEDHDISHSIYFSDPDGHALEITTYDVAR